MGDLTEKTIVTDSNERFVIDWMNRMTARYGGIVKTIDVERLDWGQALARGVYGDDWNDSDLSFVPDEAIKVATAWEVNGLPDWIRISDNRDYDGR